MSANPFTDVPKLLGDVAARDMRRKQLHEPHIKPLTDFVENLRDKVGHDVAIPDFDPWDGGTKADVLYLLEAPGGKAKQSGFISRNNPDETAKNFFQLNCEAGIARERTVTWNIVPWYIGTGTRIRPAKETDIDAGISSLPRLLNLLPQLRAIVLIGQKAGRAKDLIVQLYPRARIFQSPHPSPLFVNNAPGNRERILNVLREVKQYLES